MYLVVLQCFNEFFTCIDEHDTSSVMGLMVKLHLCPCHIKFLQKRTHKWLIWSIVLESQHNQEVSIANATCHMHVVLIKTWSTHYCRCMQADMHISGYLKCPILEHWQAVLWSKLVVGLWYTAICHTCDRKPTRLLLQLVTCTIDGKAHEYLLYCVHATYGHTYLECLLHAELLGGLVHNVPHFILKLVQVESQQIRQVRLFWHHKLHLHTCIIIHHICMFSQHHTKLHNSLMAASTHSLAELRI